MCVCCQQTMRDDGAGTARTEAQEAFVCTISGGAFVPGSAEIQEAKVYTISSFQEISDNKRVQKLHHSFPPTALAFLIFYPSSEHKVLKSTKNSCNTGGGQQRMPTV